MLCGKLMNADLVAKKMSDMAESVTDFRYTLAQAWTDASKSRQFLVCYQVGECHGARRRPASP